MPGSQVNGGRPLRSDRITNKNTPPRRPGNGSSYFNPLFAVAGHSFIHSSLGDALMLPCRADSDRVKMRCCCGCADCRGIDCRAADSV